MSLRLLVCTLRRWWEEMCRPPRPSDVYVLFLKENQMAHTKKATFALPPLRDDEKQYSTDVEEIVSRRIAYTINGGDPFLVDVPITQPSYDAGSVPASALISVGLANVTADGDVSEFNTREVTAPPAPVPIPVPDAVSVTFEDIAD